MKTNLYHKDIVSINDLSHAEIETILATANQFKAKPDKNLLENKIIANCFFESSTRTRFSFASAALRLGANVIGFDNQEGLSIQKGETLSDTIKVISAYADLIVIRHPQDGAARIAAEVSDKPVINAGDGANQHPTQALIDLFTMKTCQDQLENLSIALVGDLKHGRTIHSLVQLAADYHFRLFLVSPEALALPECICHELRKKGVRFSIHQTVDEIIHKIDILYVTRIQTERFDHSPRSTTEKTEKSAKKYLITPALLTKAKPSLKVFHPLPRVNEIDPAVDHTPHAFYFQQAANGVYIRQALLALILTEDFALTREVVHE